MAKTVLITAGASGIGSAMATQFDASGATVWITDIDQSALDKCPKHWRKSRADVRSASEMSDVFRKISDELGQLDVVCANAGTAGPTALIEEQSIEEFADCLDVNIKGAFYTARAALPIMKRQGRGSIIFTSSTAGLHGFPYRAPYCASKWAVIGMMKTIAMEAGPYGVRANVIAPGCVEGERIDGVIEREARQKNTTPEAVRAAYEAGTSLRSFVSAPDIANMAVFLSSDQANMVSGQVISVDGHTENPDPKVC